ncbi:MAG: hypothetical protein N2515_09920, partial [Deltaproteobacteria bacterium]|nr:hypothetical protein [Deltaproteobacteria bacterium]
PHKSAILSHLDCLAESAQAAGAANTIWLDQSRGLCGANTDVDAAEALLRAHFDSLDQKHAIVIGSGGAARAAIAALGRLQCFSVSVVHRNPASVEALLAQFPYIRPISLDNRWELSKAFSQASVVFQSTSAPMDHAQGEALISCLPVESIPKSAIAFEWVYRPLRTQFLRVLEAREIHVIDGLSLLVEQGIRSLALWTGRSIEEISKVPLKASLLEALVGST